MGLAAAIIETGLARGVYLWIFASVLSSLASLFNLFSGRWANTFILCIASSGGFVHLSVRGSTDAAVRRQRLTVAILAAAYGLVLYGMTRLVFPWSPGIVVAVLFFTCQAIKLGLGTAANSQQHYNMFQKLYGAQNALNSWSHAAAHIRYRVIRISRIFLCASAMALLTLGIQVLGTMMEIPAHLLPRLRALFRLWRRALRTSMPSAPWPKSQVLFKYRPLKGCSPETPKIRLLKLRRRWPFGGIHCELVDIDLLDHVQEYDAVSYHWGKARFTEEIYIQGRTLKVSPVVEDLLYRLSSYTHERFLWIDAICINQLDKAEKDLQIPLMRDIYRNAASAIVWLDGVKDAWIARRMLAGIWHEYVFGTTESCLGMLRMYSEPNADMGWMQLINLFAHPWFRRVWVIQEIVMAPKAVVLASGEMLQFDHIAGFAKMMSSNPYGLVIQRSSAPGIEDDSCIGVGHANLMAMLSERRDEPRLDLAVLLGIFSDFLATEDVDRIYGLLGLLRPDEASQPHLQPDSSRSVEALYTSVARHLIISEPAETLSYAGIGYRRKLGSLPSWAPDWTSVGQRATSRLHFSRTAHAAKFSLGSLIQAVPSFEEDSTSGQCVLIIPGSELDEIEHVGPEMCYTSHNKGLGGTDEEIDRAIRSHLTSRQLVLQHARAPYPTGEPIDEVFWRSLIANTQFERPAPESLGHGCRLWEQIMSQEAGLNPGGLHWERLTDGLSKEEAFRLALEWNSCRSSAATGRAVAVTKGGLVAMVPPLTKVGDMACLLYGLNTPFVLRPRALLDDSDSDGSGCPVRIVGEAYLHGIMDDDGWVACTQPKRFEVT
jgi:hypothetical protein